MYQSKRFRALQEKVKSIDPIPLADAIKQLKTFGTTKFIQTVEVSTNLGIDPRQSDQNVRGSVALPHGIGKVVRVAVFAQGENAEKATAAGADIVGGDDLAQRIKGGFMDFDVALATPDMMGVVGPLGRLLGPRGLMPSPRSGTVTTDISAGVREFKAGKIEFRSDKGGNVAAAVGKLNFSDEQLADNINTFLNHLQCVDMPWVQPTQLDTLTQPGCVGTARTAGINADKPRMRAVLHGVMALSLQPGGFTAAEHAAKVNELTGAKMDYTARQSAYDLRKLRGKELLTKLHPKSRRYCATDEALRTMAGLIVVRQKVIEPLLRYLGRAKSGNVPRDTAKIDQYFRDMQHVMAKVFEEFHLIGEPSIRKVLAINATAA